MGMVRNGLVGAMVAGAAVLASSTTVAVAAQAPGAAGPRQCREGRVCVWSKLDARGSFCSWAGDDRNWRTGKKRCSFRVRSLWNNRRSGATRDRVTFYRAKNYKGQITDPLPVTPRPINAADIVVGSHQWTR